MYTIRDLLNLNCDLPISKSDFQRIRSFYYKQHIKIINEDLNNQPCRAIFSKSFSDKILKILFARFTW